MKAFYKDTLGFAVKRDVPEEEFTQFALANCFLALYGKKFVETLLGQAVTGKPGSAIYSFAEGDVDLLYQQLKAKGVQFITVPNVQPWGQKTAYFTDPDGNIWEIQEWVTKTTT